MKRSGAARAASALVTLLVAGLPFAVVAAVSALPAVSVDDELGWLLPALRAAVGAASAGAAVAWLVRGLRTGSLSDLFAAGASAALAGGSVAALASDQALAAPVGAAAAFMLVSAVADDRTGALSRISTIAVAAALLTAAEAAALLGVLPLTAGAVAPFLGVFLALAVGLAVAAAFADAGRGIPTWLLAIGAAGLLADRGGSAESVVGLAALVGSQLTLARLSIEPPAAEDTTDVALPDLAARLSDAVLRFDGRLQLRDWNPAATSLLGLDASARGMRMEDLLGVQLNELPTRDGTNVSRGVIGGLEIAMHRSGAGITAVIRDPGTTTEADRLGIELRSTIEELLRARRTIELQRGELERASTVDPLTGVASRGAILERLRIEVAQARRYQHPLAVVLLDIDGFGEINRTHGIEGGDAALREVALRMRLRVRAADALGRAGSDGFMATLPHTDEGGAATFADALRHRLGQRPVAIGEALVPITVSVGVATMRPDEDLEVDGLLSRVQEALDSARAAGGNRIGLDRLHGLARLEDARDDDGDDAETPSAG